MRWRSLASHPPGSKMGDKLYIMLAEPRIEDRDAQPYAAIPVRVTLPEWGQANALLGEVLGWLAERNIPVSGPPVYRYRVIGDTDTAYELEVGWLVHSPVEGDDRVVSGEMPAGSYVTTTHTGHPDGLFQSYERLEAWAVEQGIEWASNSSGGREISGGRFELFMTDPAVEPDPAKWQVEVLYLLRDDREQLDDRQGHAGNATPTDRQAGGTGTCWRRVYNARTAQRSK